MSARDPGAPRGPVDLVVEVPGSKSLTNRALVCAALADGESRIERCAPGDDSEAMVAALAQLGVGIARDGTTLTIDGVDGQLAAGPRTLDCELAGTTSRFLTAVACLGDGPYIVDGRAPLRRRPVGELVGALRSLGARIEARDGAERLPLEIRGGISGGRCELRGDISSQYLTALMLIGPLLDGGLEIAPTTPLVSGPYVDMTVAVMRAFGAEVVQNASTIDIAPTRYRPCRYRVEPDASSASYPLALGAINGGSVRIVGLGSSSIQGDRVFADLMGAMGCDIGWDPSSVTLQRDPRRHLVGIHVDMRDCSDLVPTLATVAMFADSPTRITGVGFIRHKESDRLEDLARELRRFGTGVEVFDDGLEIRPQPLGSGVVEVTTHHDHRLAMSFGIAATAYPGTVVIDDERVVSKSWPGFWDELAGWTPRP